MHSEKPSVYCGFLRGENRVRMKVQIWLEECLLQGIRRSEQLEEVKAGCFQSTKISWACQALVIYRG